jgi:hypothetical protein
MGMGRGGMSMGACAAFCMQVRVPMQGDLISPRAPPVVLRLLGVDGKVVRRDAVLPGDDAAARREEGKDKSSQPA